MDWDKAEQTATILPGLHAMVLPLDAQEKDGRVRIVVESGPARVVAVPVSGWLEHPGDTTVIHALGQANLRLYTEKRAKHPGIRLDIRQLDQPIPLPAPPQPPPPAQIPMGYACLSNGHDVPAEMGAIFGSPNTAILGFCLACPLGVDPTWISYQGILGYDWNTPWTPLGRPIGGRNSAFPFIGVRIRVEKQAPERMFCRGKAAFLGRTATDPITGRMLELFEHGAPLSALALLIEEI